MNMASSSMTMTDMSPSITMSTAMSTATAMSGMDMDMDNSCKISMTWNWYTIDACFISKSWRITSAGMFAGSCIGVICLVVSLELLRRLLREYDRFIQKQDGWTLRKSHERDSPSSSMSSQPKLESDGEEPLSSIRSQPALQTTYRVSKLQLLQRQLIRSLLFAVQFGVAYFVMLLAMYYNGYFIICIIIGAFLGAFAFSWDQLLDSTHDQNKDLGDTGCCG